MYRCCWAEINLDIIFNASVGEMEYIKINYGKAFWLSFVGVLSQSVLQIQCCRCWMCASKTYVYQCLLNLIIFTVEKRLFYRDICSRNNIILLKFFCHSCGHEQQNGGHLFFFVSISSYQIGEESNNQIWSINQA